MCDSPEKEQFSILGQWPDLVVYQPFQFIDRRSNVAKKRLHLVRISVLGVGVLLIVVAVFGEEIYRALEFGIPNPGFGPTQWIVLIVGVVLVVAGYWLGSKASQTPD